MADDLFEGRFGAIIAFITVVIFLCAFYFDITTRNIIWTIFFFAFGVINFWNYKIAAKSRYLVSAGIFVLAGIAGLINIFYGDIIRWRVIWLVTIILFVLAVPIAALLRGLSIWKKKDSIPE